MGVEQLLSTLIFIEIAFSHAWLSLIRFLDICGPVMKLNFRLNINNIEKKRHYLNNITRDSYSLTDTIKLICM